MDRIHGVTFDGAQVWFARGESIVALDPKSGAMVRELRHINPETGEVLERFEMPAGATVSGLEADGAGVFYCGGAGSGKVRAVRKPKP
jgi:hypothetical protein